MIEEVEIDLAKGDFNGARKKVENMPSNLKPIVRSILYEREGRYIEAYTLAMKAPDRLPFTYIRRAYGAWRLGNYEEALSHAKIVMKEEGVRGRAQNISALSLWSWGKMRGEFGKFERAIIYLQDAFERSNSEDFMHSFFLNNLGNVFSSMEQYEKAMTMYNHALDVRERAGYLSLYATTVRDIGRLFQRLGKLDEAELKHREALTIRKKIKNPLDIAKSQMSLGETLMEKGMYTEGRKLMREAGVIFEKLKLRKMLDLVNKRLDEKPNRK